VSRSVGQAENQMKRVFICHASKDKATVRRIAVELERYGVRVWLDERELRVGDSLRERIEQAIEDSDHILVVLSRAALRRPWVKKEINAAFSLETDRQTNVILPVLIDPCEVPLLLRDKLYADFREDFDLGMQQLLRTFLVDPHIGGHNLETVKCLVTLDLLRLDGSYAKYTKVQHHRCILGSSEGYVDSMSGDGDLTDFAVTPGRIAGIRKESGIYFVDTRFPKPLREGQSITRRFSCVFRKSFLGEEEWWDERQYHPSRDITVLIRFPKARPPQTWETVEREGPLFRPSDYQARRTTSQGKPALKLVMDRPRFLASYVVRWTW